MNDRTNEQAEERTCAYVFKDSGEFNGEVCEGKELHGLHVYPPRHNCPDEHHPFTPAPSAPEQRDVSISRPSDLQSAEQRDAPVELHRCNACLALWRRFPDGSWSLYPGEECGPCCDNVAMGAQIILTRRAPHAPPAEQRESARERIVAAAIYADGIVNVMAQPARHHDIIHAMATRGDRTPIDGAQGFVTSEGRFVGRTHAKRIAQKAGQLLERASSSDQLFSEDVW